MKALETAARSLAQVSTGVACAGTALECRTYLVAKKAFLFVSAKEARLKLADSAGEARRLGLAVGANGWVKLAADALPAASVLKRWVAESHALAQPAPASGSASSPARRPAKGSATRAKRSSAGSAKHRKAPAPKP